MSELWVTNVYNQQGDGAPNFPNGATVTGVITATSFSGSGANLTGIDATALKDGSGNVKIQANSTGAVVTGILTVSSSVSVGGTLTYEDVTNIDSVGLITARQGIKVTGGDVQVGSAVTVDTSGINVTGVVTATSYRGDGSQLSGIEAAPTITATADGAIAANKPVRLNEDGTISEIKNTNISAATGSNTDIPHQYNPVVKEAVWISSTKFILFWVADDYDDRLQAAVGTVSGTSITYGSRLQISTDTNVWRVSATYDSSLEVVVLAYNILNSGAYIKGLTVSGTTITINGTGHSTGDATSTCDIASDNKGGFVFAWVNTSQQWQVKAGTVTSAGAISVGTQIHIANSRTIDSAYNTMRICYDKHSDAWVSICRFNNNTDYSICTRSGTSVTETSNNTPPTIISGTDNSNVNIVYYETEQRFLITSRSNSSPYGIKYATPKMGNGNSSLDSGGTGTWNEGAQDNSGYLAYDVASNKAFYIFANDTGGDTKLLTITLNASGTTGGTGSLVSEQLENYKEVLGLAVACNGEGMVLTGVDKSDDSDVNTKVKQLAVTVSNLKADNSFIGFSGDAISDSASGTIKVVGNIATQSGLTPSKKYYVQRDGTVSKGADDPSVVAGVALSSTTILIKG